MIEHRLAETDSQLDDVDRRARGLRDDVRQSREKYLKLMRRKPVQKALVGFSFATSAIHGRGA